MTLSLFLSFSLSLDVNPPTRALPHPSRHSLPRCCRHMSGRCFPTRLLASAPDALTVRAHARSARTPSLVLPLLISLVLWAFFAVSFAVMMFVLIRLCRFLFTTLLPCLVFLPLCRCLLFGGPCRQTLSSKRHSERPRCVGSGFSADFAISKRTYARAF
jgi:hypothetical protein